ncbi:MAG: GtrA family protein [Candidatus Hodarchaeales archaeon]
MPLKLPNLMVHISLYRSFYIKMVNFIIVSCLGLVINTIVFVLTLRNVPDFVPVYPILLELSLPDRIWEFFSVMTAIAITTLWNFIINKIWTFRKHGKEKHVAVQTTQYMIVGAIGAIENLGVYALCRSFLLFDEIISAIIGFIVSVLSNFILNNFWTFADEEEERKTPS